MVQETIAKTGGQIVSLPGTLKIIYLPRQLGDVLPPVPSLVERVVLMSTYEEFQLIISVALLIVSILNYVKRNNKK